MIGNRIGARAIHPTNKEPSKTCSLLQNTFMFMVHVKKIKTPLASGKTMLHIAQKLSQDRGAKGIEEEGNTRSCGKGELGSVSAMDAHWGLRTTRFSPDGQISAGNPEQGGIEFHPHNAPERIFGGQQQASTHSSAKIYKSVFVERSHLLASPPTPDKGAED